MRALDGCQRGDQRRDRRAITARAKLFGGEHDIARMKGL
jgi:hypothetical protein